MIISKTLRVVGTSHYQDNIKQFCGAGVPIDLTHEPDNPHDSNAIRLHFLTHTFGYVDRRTAKELAEGLSEGHKYAVLFARKNKNPKHETVGLVVDVVRED